MAPRRILPSFAWKRFGDLETVFLKTAETKAANVGKIVFGDTFGALLLCELKTSQERANPKLPRMTSATTTLPSSQP